MSGVKRLTPIVPGEVQPFLWIDGTVKTGFFGGPTTEGRGFPQWAKDAFGCADKAHYFGEPDEFGISAALCERTEKVVAHLYLPGNFPRCKECTRIRKLRERYR
jgi:hypothetical protein